MAIVVIILAIGMVGTGVMAYVRDGIGMVIFGLLSAVMTVSLVGGWLSGAAW